MAEPSGYGYYKEITVQDANIDGNLTNVPTLIQIAADSDIGGNIEDTTTGHDIRFYDITTDAILYYDRVYFAVAAGDCNATFYVKAPALYASPSSNQNKLRIYYGKAADSDGEDKANTWSDYIFVHHCVDASGTLTDATGTHNSDDEQISNYQQTGKIRYCIDFDNAASDYATLADHADFDINTFTIQCWQNLDIVATGDYSLFRFQYSPSNEGFALRGGGTAGSNAYADSDFYDSGVSRDAQTDANTLDVSVWFLSHTTMDSDGLMLAYANGVVGSNTGDFGGAISWSTASKWAFGASEVHGNNINGRLEEIRCTSSVLSANHIKFEHTNVNEADNELTWGAEQAVSGAPYTIECTTGTYAITGATLNALKGSKAICTAGTYAITGADLNPLRGYRATCTTGAYVLTGAQLNPVYQENVTITPAVFNLILTFNAPSIGLGITSKGSEFHMFMDLSMN